MPKDEQIIMPEGKGNMKLKNGKTNDEMGRPVNFSFRKGDEKKNERINFKHYNDLLHEKEPDEKDTTYSSIWRYRKGKMIEPFTDKVAEENPYFSEFNPLISQNITNFWCDEGDVVLDPFAGRTRGIVSGLTHRKYYGFEISKSTFDKVNDVIQSGKDKFDEGFMPILYNDDSFNMENYNEIPEVDLIYSCPPYWNLEKYPSCDGQLSDIDKYEVFLDRLTSIIEKCSHKLKTNGFICLVVGDFRVNEGERLLPFDSDLARKIEEIKGIVLWDKIVIQNVNNFIASRRFGAIKHRRITSKVSEYLLVFKKLF